MRRTIPLLLVATLATPAYADKAACLVAHEEAQRLRTEGKLRAARERLLICSANACPSLVKVDCTKWLPEVDRDVPTVIVHARDSSFTDIADVRVEIDGVVVAKFLDGKPIALDPGTHTFKLVRPDGVAVEQQVVVAAGEKNRKVDVVFAGTAPPEDAAPRSRSVLPWVLAGVGVVGVASFAALGLTARNRLDELRETCAPSCDPDERSTIRTQLILADVSLVIGVSALGAATYLWLRPAPNTAVAFTPTRSGGFASLRVTF